MTFVPDQALAQMNLLRKIKAHFYLLPSLLMIGSALLKLFNIASVTGLYNAPDLQDQLLYLGVIELISIIFYLFKQTMLIGFFLICVFWGGVISISIVSHIPSYLPIAILLLFGLSLYWRDPSLFKRFEKSYE
jgi:hypothetical protein